MDVEKSTEPPRKTQRVVQCVESKVRQSPATEEALQASDTPQAGHGASKSRISAKCLSVIGHEDGKIWPFTHVRTYVFLKSPSYRK